jgi:hypothetical protein
LSFLRDFKKFMYVLYGLQNDCVDICWGKSEGRHPATNWYADKNPANPDISKKIILRNMLK